jgi:hypothetical protein
VTLPQLHDRIARALTVLDVLRQLMRTASAHATTRAHMQHLLTERCVALGGFVKLRQSLGARTLMCARRLSTRTRHTRAHLYERSSSRLRAHAIDLRETLAGAALLPIDVARRGLQRDELLLNAQQRLMQLARVVARRR